MLKKKINSKFAFIISGIYSSIFAIFTTYKSIILYQVKLAMEDTFVGGNTSDISIFLWISISCIMLLVTFLFFFFLKIKDLKSQKIVLTGITLTWLFVIIVQLFLFSEYFYFAAFTLFPISICLIAIKNLKIEIIKKLNEKGLSENEIHLLQLLAGIKKD